MLINANDSDKCLYDSDKLMLINANDSQNHDLGELASNPFGCSKLLGELFSNPCFRIKGEVCWSSQPTKANCCPNLSSNDHYSQSQLSEKTAQIS